MSQEDLSFLLAGIFFATMGVLFLARARTIASFIAGKAHAVPPVLAALFLLRARPAQQSETARYLCDIYRLGGVGATLVGLVMICSILFLKPAPP